MKVMNDANNMIFDLDDSRCLSITSQLGFKHVAFIQVLDIGNPGNRLSEPHVKRYWGHFDPNNPEASYKEIMNYGSKWPELPPFPS